jgi:hypothetical protein
VKQALLTTPKKRVAVMASYLDNKHSPTVKSLEKLNFVVSPEDKTNTQFGNAVIHDIRLTTIFNFSRDFTVGECLLSR